MVRILPPTSHFRTSECKPQYFVPCPPRLLVELATFVPAIRRVEVVEEEPEKAQPSNALVGGERLRSSEADPVDPCEVGVCRDQSVELRGELPELVLREAVERAFSKLETQNNWEIEITKAIGDPKTKARGR